MAFRSTQVRDVPEPRRLPRRRGRFGDRSGQSLALVAVIAVPLLGMVGLAVDLGMLMNAHSEAHRAAEAGALAGAGAFYCFEDPTPCTVIQADSAARDSAMVYARRNYVHGEMIDSAEVYTEVWMDQRKVRVTIRRDAVSTFFAKIIGFDQVPIQAYAAAVLSDAGTGRCILPFYGPDLWRETEDNNQIPEPTDVTPWDLDEASGDIYQPLGDDNSVLGTFNGTGYGSNLRNAVPDYNGFYTDADWGRLIKVTVDTPDPKDAEPLGETFAPGNFSLWSPPMEDCDSEDPDPPSGLPPLLDLIRGEDKDGNAVCSCPIKLGEEYVAEPRTGDPMNPIDNALQTRLSKDPDAVWSTVENDLVSPFGEESARVVTIAIADPRSAYELQGGSIPVTFNNFARVFIEGWEDDTWKSRTLHVRFMGFVGGGPGPVTGTLVKYLHLVE